MSFSCFPLPDKILTEGLKETGCPYLSQVIDGWGIPEVSQIKVIGFFSTTLTFSGTVRSPTIFGGTIENPNKWKQATQKETLLCHISVFIGFILLLNYLWAVIKTELSIIRLWTGSLHFNEGIQRAVEYKLDCSLLQLKCCRPDLMTFLENLKAGQ